MEGSKFLHLIADIKGIAKRDSWEVQYNKELDTFYWSRNKISKDAKLKQFLEDFSLYITSVGNIEGVFIEYALTNYFSHHKELGPLGEILVETRDSTGVLSEVQETNAKPYLDDIADKIGSETLKAFIKNPKLNEVLK